MSKKNNIVLIVSIVIAVIAVIVCVWYVDNTKIVESYMDVALKIKEKKTQNNLNESGPYAYVVEEKDNKIICTVYGTQDYTRLVQVLELENGKVVKSSHEMYFPNKLSAKLYDVDYKDKKVVGNVIYGMDSVDSQWVGKTRDVVLQDLDDVYGFMVKIEF